MTGKFNIRIYGIWQRHGQILISHEQSGDLAFHKFPGGGLEQGEGIADALRREFMEELGVNIHTPRLFYINENYIPSAFDPTEQLISVYFRVQSGDEPVQMGFEEMRWGKPYKVNFKWVPEAEILPSLFHFPVDKNVAEKLRMELDSA